MKVRDFINYLKTLDQDADVLIKITIPAYHCSDDLESVDVSMDSDFIYYSKSSNEYIIGK